MEDKCVALDTDLSPSRERLFELGNELTHCTGLRLASGRKAVVFSGSESAKSKNKKTRSGRDYAGGREVRPMPVYCRASTLSSGLEQVKRSWRIRMLERSFR